MKKKNLFRKVVTIMCEDNEIRVFGYCIKCGEKITDEIEDYYCNDDGECFCSIECIMEHYNISKIEV